MQGLYNKLYLQLSTDMHAALNKLIAHTASKGAKKASGKPEPAVDKSKGAKGPSKHELAVLKGLADEAELTGDQSAADTYHQERILAPAHAQVTFHSLHFLILMSCLICTRLSCCCLARLICLPLLHKSAYLPWMCIEICRMLMMRL